MNDPGRTPSYLLRAWRAVSPVVGVTLMVVIVILLSSIVAGFALSFDDKLDEPDLQQTDTDDELNPWADDALLAPKDPVAGAEDVEYRLLFEIESSDSLSEDSEELSNIDVVVSTSDDMFTGVGEADLERLEINGAEQDVDASDITWDSDSGGAELNIETDGFSYDPSEGDEMVLVFGGVDNPESPGTYDVDVELNGDDQKDGEIEIVDEIESLVTGARYSPMW